MCIKEKIVILSPEAIISNEMDGSESFICTITRWRSILLQTKNYYGKGNNNLVMQWSLVTISKIKYGTNWIDSGRV